MYLKPFLRLACLLILTCSSLSASAQQVPGNKRTSANSVTYGFVSPNTREGLKIDDALRGLASSEEDKLVQQARGLRCVAQSNIEALKAVGSWNDGAEHSVMMRLQTDAPTMRYIISVLGRDAQQKAALYFHSNASGTAEMYILRPQARVGTMRRLSGLLDQAGIEYRTLVPTKTSILVYVVDLKRELRAKILAAARRIKARVMSRRGSAEFIGDDASREKARDLFDNEIRVYETKNSGLITRCRVRSSNVQR